MIEELFYYDIQDSALALFKFYLEDQYQQFVIGSAMSESPLLQCGVPSGSALGPILFLVYTHSLALCLVLHGVDGHFYADDCQIYLPIANKVLASLSVLKTWMRE